MHWKYAVALVVAGLVVDVYASLLRKGGGAGAGAGAGPRGFQPTFIPGYIPAEYVGTGITVHQLRQLIKVDVLVESKDWRGVVAMERQVRAVAEAVRATDPRMAAFGYSILGTAYWRPGRRVKTGETLYRSLEDFAKAVEYHKEHLAIAKEVGDRAEEGGAYNNLANAYESMGDFTKATECHAQYLLIAKEVRGRPKSENAMAAVERAKPETLNPQPCVYER